MDRRRVQAVLSTWFAQWGLPAQLRVDNGAPWGGRNDLPPDLALWLLGLGITIVWNGPAIAKAMRSSSGARGLSARGRTSHLPPPGRAASALGLLHQGAAGNAIRCGTATAGWRPFRPWRRVAPRIIPAEDGQQWDERRVWTWLGQRVWTRRVDKVGRLSLANHPLGVGKAWAGQEVTVRLIVADDAPAWVIRDRQGTLLRQHPAPALSRERILALDVSRRRPTRPRPVKPRVHHEGEPYPW